ncbi:hypothetical protein CBL_01647 [Carabus blaptoides fortunei]
MVAPWLGQLVQRACRSITLNYSGSRPLCCSVATRRPRDGRGSTAVILFTLLPASLAINNVLHGYVIKNTRLFVLIEAFVNGHRFPCVVLLAMRRQFEIFFVLNDENWKLTERVSQPKLHELNAFPIAPEKFQKEN